ncbi:ankyrin-2 [Teleopsis dalmanni]|uniref:ankyrin-2 n=1 Tax=Teleopsis dalmanni TaxID=139649 RepID=UPI0018CD50B1|nr:ankyrin-2 [Teleopsis dalmanni]
MFESSLISANDLNERLLAAIQICNYEDVLHYLIKGAKATLVSSSSGRTGVGTAALVGDAEILELLIQSCEEPDSDIFKKSNLKSKEIEVDCTPDGMDNLEWEDEFLANCTDTNNCAPDEIEAEYTSLYYYYAKTFEQTGAIISSIDDMEFRNHCIMTQDPHTMDALLMTPLHYAAVCGHMECTTILMDHGANPNLKTINTGETALHLAIKNRCTEVANFIIENTSNVNETDDLNQTPLICAIICGLNAIAYTLIDRGARINLHDKDNHTALYYAVAQNDVQMAACLIRHGARRVTSHYLLHHCVRFNFKNMAELLLNNENGESLNVLNNEGVSPIWLAVILKNVDMLEFLLTTLKHYKIVNGSYLTEIKYVEDELMLAINCFQNVIEFKPIARVLFAYSGGDWLLHTPKFPKCQAAYCKTLLGRAIMLKKYDIAEFLIKEGINVNKVCQEHVVYHLRSNPEIGFNLVKLLVCTGFQFPVKITQKSTDCSVESKTFEENIRKLNSMPLSLQLLSRIVIRQHFINLLQNSKMVNRMYTATRESSTLAFMIKELDIPLPLKNFLIYFNDCPDLQTKVNY